MAENDSAILRELLRNLVRHLGILEKSDACCCGVSLVQCHAIVEIGRRGKINLNDLADLLDVDKSTMSRTINNLVTEGLVARELDHGDRRYVVIQLTENGRRLFTDTETGMERYFQRVLARIAEDRRAQVLASLKLLTEATEHERCCADAAPVECYDADEEPGSPAESTVHRSSTLPKSNPQDEA